MAITALPPAPQRNQSAAVFSANADAFVAALSTFVTETNALASALNGIAAGTAFAVPYVFSTTTTDSDPGNGYLRLDSSTQNTATTIRADLAGSDGKTWTSVLDTFDDSTNTIKGQILLVKLGDATKWLAFNVTALSSPSGYKNITVANVAASDANPFANNDSVILKFTRSGDVGSNGINAGLSYTYSNSTTNADPTSGKLKFDNTILASATKLYISETDANSNNIGGELATWDDSTSTIKGTLKVHKATDITKFAIFQITGNLTDNGAWDTFNLTYVTGAGSLTDSDSVTVTFFRTGDAAISAGNNIVDVSNGNGHGSTNTKIRRFTTTVTSTGTAITYADSATNGASFTINEAGMYAITYTERNNTGTENFGISLNSSELTTGIPTITNTARLAMSSVPAANVYASVSYVAKLAVSDVIRAHTEGATNVTDAGIRFTIRKIG